MLVPLMTLSGSGTRTPQNTGFRALCHCRPCLAAFCTVLRIDANLTGLITYCIKFIRLFSHSASVPDTHEYLALRGIVLNKPVIFYCLAKFGLLSFFVYYAFHSSYSKITV